MEFYMESFKQYFVESKSDDVFLMEKLITLGGKAYTNCGQFVILDCGACSG